MANTRFNLDITAKDKTGQAIDQINKRFAEWGKRTDRIAKPLANAQKSIDAIGRSVGLDKWTRAFGGIGSQALDASSGIGAMATEFLGLSEGAAAVAAGLGGLATAAVGVGVGAVAMADKWSAGASEAVRGAQDIGMSVNDLLAFEAAGRKVGVQGAAMKASLEGIGEAASAASLGLNNDALSVIQTMGIQIRRTKDGLIDVKQLALDLADVAARQTPQNQAKLASIFGFSGSLRAFRQGSGRLQQDMAGAVTLSPRQQATATTWQRNMAELETQTSREANIIWSGIGGALSPVVEGSAKALGRFNDLVELPGKKILAERTAIQGMAFLVNAATGFRPGAQPGSAKAAATRAPRVSSIPTDSSAAAINATFDDFAKRIEQQESGRRQFWRNGAPKVSPKGAVGAMQLMPDTAAAIADRIGVGFDAHRLAYDQGYNEMLGRAELKRLLDKYGGDQVLASAAYNAGDAVVDDWIGGGNRSGKNRRGRRLGDPRAGEVSDMDWAAGIPFGETRDYVASTVPVEITLRLANLPQGTTVDPFQSPHANVSVRVVGTGVGGGGLG